jgi:hypothetical protein
MHLFIPWKRVLLEKSVILQVLKKFPTFYQAQMFNNVFTTSTTVTYPEHDAFLRHPHTSLATYQFLTMV